VIQPKRRFYSVNLFVSSHSFDGSRTHTMNTFAALKRTRGSDLQTSVSLRVHPEFRDNGDPLASASHNAGIEDLQVPGDVWLISIECLYHFANRSLTVARSRIAHDPTATCKSAHAQAEPLRMNEPTHSRKHKFQPFRPSEPKPYKVQSTSRSWRAC